MRVDFTQLPGPAASGDNVRQLRVLIVDDDPDYVSELMAALSKPVDVSALSMTCQSAESVHETIKLIRHQLFDIILLGTTLADLPTPSAISVLRKAFAYSPIIAISKYPDEALALEWVEAGADDCLYEGVINPQILHRVINYAVKRAITYRELHQRSQNRHIINELLNLSLQDLPLDELLQRCLEIILSAPFAEIQNKGGIFLADEEQQMLHLVAESQLEEKIAMMCNQVPFGTCLCGRAAEQKRLIHVKCVDERHEIRFEGMRDHGHYCVPIVAKDTVLGVIVLYLDQGHAITDEERDFLNGVAKTLAGIIQHGRTLEQLVKIHNQNSALLASIKSILIGVDSYDCISHWNEAAEDCFGLSAEQVLGRQIMEIGIKWDWEKMLENILACMTGSHETKRFDVRFQHAEGINGLLSVVAAPSVDLNGVHAGFLLIGEDVTEQKSRESRLQQVQKLQSIGQLAAGIAHEINTPIQYVGDNVRFLLEAFEDMNRVITQGRVIFSEAKQSAVSLEVLQRMEQTMEDIDLDYLQEEIPSAIEQTLGGISRVAEIVRAMKEFSHPGSEKRVATDINRAIESTIMVSRNVWKYQADVVTSFDDSLTSVPCIAGPFNEVILNVIVNAAHAISGVVGDGSDGKGVIKVSTECLDDWGEIRISDTGTGIPKDVQPHVFDPFFTTKEVGEGTGQGLALSHDIIVGKHEGEFTFETEIGKGTTFIIRLPLND